MIVTGASEDMLNVANVIFSATVMLLIEKVEPLGFVNYNTLMYALLAPTSFTTVGITE